MFFFAGPEAAENEDGSANTGLADFDAFGGGGYAEPIRAGYFQGLGDLRAAVAVRVAFDDGENFARSVSLFGSGIYIIADGAKIFCERGERNFGPNGAADEIGGIWIFL